MSKTASFICLSTGDRIAFTDAGGGIETEWPVIPPRALLQHIGISLSRTPRFAGHTVIPYNVCAHSIVCLKLAELKTDDSLALFHVLLHDAHEAVIGDIPTPVKQLIGLEAVKRVETALDIALWKNLGVQPPSESIKAFIKEVDSVALHAERLALGTGWKVARPDDFSTAESRQMTADVAELANENIEAICFGFAGMAMELLPAAKQGGNANGQGKRE